MSKLVALYQKKIGLERKEIFIEIDKQTEITRENTEKLEELAIVKVGLPYRKIGSWIRD